MLPKLRSLEIEPGGPVLALQVHGRSIRCESPFGRDKPQPFFTEIVTTSDGSHGQRSLSMVDVSPCGMYMYVEDNGDYDEL